MSLLINSILPGVVIFVVIDTYEFGWLVDGKKRKLMEKQN